MKSYTDIEQSKILAEILPIESADMHYSTWTILDGEFIVSPNQGSTIENLQEDYGNQIIPCWSLAALLNALPTYLFEFDRGIDLNIYPNLNGRGWHCSYIPNCIENMKTDKFRLITNGDTLVDACYEMILKLKEKNLL